MYGQLYTTYKKETIKEVFYKTERNDKNLFIGKSNDVIIPASGETPEDISTACCVLEEGIIFGGDLNVIRSSHNGSFLSYQLNGKRKFDIAKLAIGKSIVHLHNEQLKRLECFFPHNIEEENKIVKFLNNLDEKIDVQNKIIDNLYSQKKYLKSIIFRNNISNHKIGDFLEEYTEKNVNNYEPVSVGKYGIRKRTEIFSRELSEDYSKNKVIHKDSLTIGMGTKEIDIAILFEDSHYCVSPAYTTYRIKNIDSYYFNELLDSLNYLLSLRYMISGARQGKSVNKKELMNHQIFVHTAEQQSVIKNLLKSVYNKIDNETKLLEKYSQQKNYLLNNLFI